MNELMNASKFSLSHISMSFISNKSIHSVTECGASEAPPTTLQHDKYTSLGIKLKHIAVLICTHTSYHVQLFIPWYWYIPLYLSYAHMTAVIVQYFLIPSAASSFVWRPMFFLEPGNLVTKSTHRRLFGDHNYSYHSPETR